MSNYTRQGSIPGSFKNIFDVPDNRETSWIYRASEGLHPANENDTWTYEIQPGQVYDLDYDIGCTPAEYLLIMTHREHQQVRQSLPELWILEPQTMPTRAEAWKRDRGLVLSAVSVSPEGIDLVSGWHWGLPMHETLVIKRKWNYGQGEDYRAEWELYGWGEHMPRTTACLIQRISLQRWRKAHGYLRDTCAGCGGIWADGWHHVIADGVYVPNLACPQWAKERDYDRERKAAYTAKFDRNPNYEELF